MLESRVSGLLLLHDLLLKYEDTAQIRTSKIIKLNIMLKTPKLPELP